MPPAKLHGQRVLRGVRNNDLYVLTTPEFEAEFRARGEAILASLPKDVNGKSKASERKNALVSLRSSS